MRKKEAKFTTKFMSEVGTKLKNNDYFGFVQLDNYGIWIITDGYDEEEGGDIAAKMAVEAGIEYFMAHPRFNTEVLEEIIQYTNEKIILKQQENEKNSLMHTSMLVVITNYNSILYGNVGNTRFYHLRDGYIINQSSDDTIAQLLVEEGALTTNDIRFHRQRNDLLQAIGDYSKVKPYITNAPITLQEGDTICLTTMGFWENVSETEMEVEIGKYKNRDILLKVFGYMILSSKRDSVENYTLSIIDIEKVAPPEVIEKNNNKNKKRILLGILLGLIVTSTILGWSIITRRKIEKKGMNYDKIAEKDIVNKKFIRAKEDFTLAIGEYQKVKEKTKGILGFLTGGKIKNSEMDRKIESDKIKIKQLDKLEKAFKFINEGDNLFKTNQFDEALKKYQEGKYILQENEIKKDELKLGELVNRLETKINSCIKLKEGMEIIKAGDKAYSASNFKLATENYEQAVDIFLSNDRADYVSEVKMKLEKIGEKQKTDYNNAMLLENKGDLLMGSSPRMARNEYYKAREIYQSLGDTVKSQEIDNKIEGLNSKQLAELQSAKELVQEGLNSLSTNNPSGAISNFNRAKNIYEHLDDKNNMKSIDNYIRQAQNAIVISNKAKEDELKAKERLEEKEKELEKAKEETKDEKNERENIEKELKRASELEVSGDKLLLAERYSESIQKYSEAEEIYKKLEEKDVDNKDKVEHLDEKICKGETYLYKKQGDEAVRDKKWKEAVKKYMKAKKSAIKAEIEESVKDEIEAQLKKAIIKAGKKWWQFWK